MPEPRIQYTKTSDGVRIAFTVVGQGPPLVTCGDISDAHAQLMWEHSPAAPLYKRLATRYSVVKYDPRGFGLSDRSVTDFSLGARVADVEAVVEHLGLAGFSLVGYLNGGTTAIAYAARYPEPVRRLALVSSWPRTAEMLSLHRATGAASLIRTDWEMFLHVLAAANTGFGKEEAGRVAEFLAIALEPASFVRWAWGTSTDDVSDLLRDIACPTLIVHYSGLHYLTMDMGRELASGIRNSRLLVVKAPPRMRREFEAAGNVVLEFLQEGEASAVLEVPSGTAVILFADIVDSTALTERMGDTAFREKARDLDAALRTIIRENNGTPIEGKLLGDGVLAVFTSARLAIEAALPCGRAGDDVGLPLHLGINAGDVLHETDPDGRANVYGGAVNIAARIAADSAPGEVLVSETVRSLARTSSGVRFEDRGERELKGVGEPVRVWSVRADD